MSKLGGGGIFKAVGSRQVFSVFAVAFHLFSDFFKFSEIGFPGIGLIQNVILFVFQTYATETVFTTKTKFAIFTITTASNIITEITIVSTQSKIAILVERDIPSFDTALISE